MDTEEYHQKLNARWLNETMYTFSRYFENVKASEKKSVLKYDWSLMLPSESQINTDNPYENHIYRNIYSNLVEKNFLPVKIYFLKKRVRRFIKNFRNEENK